MAVFAEWMADAERGEKTNPNAATLATIGEGGMPQARTILVKEHGAAGFVFFTNRESRKGLALRRCAKAALVFYWKSSGRQVLAEGEARELPRARVARYFRTRPRQSQIGAWASRQSRPIDDYATLAAAAELLDGKYRGKLPPLPPHWSGFCLRPSRIEFWLEGKARLHQRLCFWRGDDNKWQTSLLQP